MPKLKTTDQKNGSLREASKLIETIFHPGDLIEIRAINADGDTWQEWFKADEFAERHSELVNLNNDGYSIYFGANPRIDEGGGKDSVETARCLILDLDDCDPQVLLDRCEEHLGAKPTITWATGGGGQAAIVLEHEIPIDRWQRLQRGLIATIPGADATIKDAPRLLRLPGFHNRKSKYAPRFPLAKIIDENPGSSFSPDALPEGPDFSRTPSGEPIPSMPLPYPGYLPRRAIAFLDEGELYPAPKGAEQSRRQTAFAVACAARGPGEEPNIPIEDITERILERLIDLGLEGRDLDDMERQIANAYSEPREVTIDDEDLPKVRLPKLSGKPVLEVSRADQNRYCLKVRVGSRFHVDELDISRADRRARFLADIKSRFGDTLETAEIEDQLQGIAAGEIEVADTVSTLPAAPDFDDELDPGSTIRPERWIVRERDEVSSAFTVGVTHKRGGELESQWVSYVTRGGRREAILLPSEVEIGDSVFHVDPPDIGDPPKSIHSWSKRSRRDWLASGRDELPPAEMFSRLAEMFARFVDFDTGVSGDMIPVLAVFAAATYCTPAFRSFAYLNFSGPYGSGKSRVLESLREIVHRPAFTQDLTPAVLFRNLSRLGQTLMLDEAERISDADLGPYADIRSIFLAGYRQGGIVERCEGDDHTPRAFRVDGFKCLAAQNPLDSTLSSRCIRTYMTRCPKNSPLIKNDPAKACFASEWQDLRDALFTWAINRGPQLLDLPPGDELAPRTLSPRSQEIWTPLLQIADLFEREGVSGLVEQMQAVASMKENQLASTAITEVELQVLRVAVELAERHRENPKQFKIPTPKAIADRVAVTSRDVYPKTVAAILRSFGFESRILTGSPVFDMPRERVLTIESRYSLDLGLAGKLEATTISDRSPSSPSSPSGDQPPRGESEIGDEATCGKVRLPRPRSKLGDQGDEGDQIQSGAPPKSTSGSRRKPKAAKKSKSEPLATEDRVRPGEVEL